MSVLRFAIIGCGKIAARHAAEAKKQGELVAVCDIIPERADALARQFGAKAYYDIGSLLSAPLAIDLIAICTPNGLHAQHTIQSLEAGIHVLCEKPLSIATADAEKMMSAAARHHRKLFVVKSTRYNPAIRALKEALDQQLLGKIYSFQLNCFWNRPEAYYADSWRGKELDGGSLFTQFSHYIDALLWLLGDLKEAKGFRRNMAHTGSVMQEDSGIAALEMESGVTGGLNWSVNTYRENMEVSLTLLAEQATIQLGGAYMNEVKYLQSDRFSLDIPPGGSANDYLFYKGSMSNHDQVYENLVRALADERHPFTSAEDGYKTVEAIEKIYQSVRLS